MEVANPRAAFLSNHEVLTLLTSLDSAALSPSAPIAYASLPANLRQITTETRAYLTSKHVDAGEQTDESVRMLVEGLKDLGLTKAEKLQVVNLMPTTMVVLYTIIEDFEYRFPGESANQILALVSQSQALASQALASSRPSQASPFAREAGEGGEGGGEGLFLPDDEVDVAGQQRGGETETEEVIGEGDWMDDLAGPEEGGYELDEERDGD